MNLFSEEDRVNIILSSYIVDKSINIGEDVLNTPCGGSVEEERRKRNFEGEINDS